MMAPPLPPPTSGVASQQSYTEFCLGVLAKQHPDVDRLYLGQLLAERNNSIEQTEKFLTEQKNRATSHFAPTHASNGSGGGGGAGLPLTLNHGGGGGRGVGMSLDDAGVPEMDGSFV